MTELTIHLGQVETEALDEIMTGTLGYRRSDRHRAEAMAAILLNYRHLLGERGDRKAESVAAQQALRDQIDIVVGERNAVRRALDAERATRRRDRQRHAKTRERLRDARNALQRLAESRAAYRDLALRVEAALARAPPRRDLGDLEGRIDRALHAAGFAMPPAPDR